MSLTSLLLGTSFQNPWKLLYKLQIEMRHRKIGSTIGIGFMAAAPLSRQWIFFLRRFQDIPCDAVAELIEIIIKIAYISCFFRWNGQLPKCLHDILARAIKFLRAAQGQSHSAARSYQAAVAAVSTSRLNLPKENLSILLIFYLFSGKAGVRICCRTPACFLIAPLDGIFYTRFAGPAWQAGSTCEWMRYHSGPSAPGWIPYPRRFPEGERQSCAAGCGG